jgi:hypothetical protein
MSVAGWLICASALAQPAPMIPGIDPNQPLNFLYTPLPSQSGKKNPLPEPPPEEKPKIEQPTTLAEERAADRPWYSVHGQGAIVGQGN